MHSHAGLVSRRTFLWSLASLALASCATRSPLVGIPAPRRRTSTDVGCLLMAQAGALALVHPNREHVELIEIPNQSPHSVVLHPRDRHLALVIDQEGPFTTQVDLRAKRVLRVLQAEGGALFSGHGVFTSDQRLFLPEYAPVDRDQGTMVVRDATTLEKQRTFHTHGARAHNVMLLDHERLLLVGHQGAPGGNGEPLFGGNLVFLSAETGELRQKFVPPDPYWYMSHFDVDGDGGIVVSTQTYYSFTESAPGGKAKHHFPLVTPLLFGRYGSEEWPPVLPPEIMARMKQNHTVMVDRRRGRAIVAHLHGNLVSVWDMKRRKLLRALDWGSELPTGIEIARGEEDVYVITSLSSKVRFVHPDSLEVMAEFDGARYGLSRDGGAKHVVLSPDLSRSL